MSVAGTVFEILPFVCVFSACDREWPWTAGSNNVVVRRKTIAHTWLNFDVVLMCGVGDTFCSLYFLDVGPRWFLANVNVLSPVRLSVVCLSVTLVRPTQAVQIFRNISTVLGTLAIHRHPLEILRRSSQGKASAGGVKHKRGSKIWRFWTYRRLYLGNGAR